MAKKLLAETTATALKKTGAKWRVVLAAPGKGNSGTYTRDILMEQGPAALPAGTKSWIGHNPPEKRDPRDQLGTYSGAWYDDEFDKDEYPEGALVTDLTVRPAYADMIEEIAEDAQFSIYLEGDKDEFDNVTAMYPARWNSVDLVAYGGLEGAGLKHKLTESFQLEGKNPSDESSALDKKEGNVDPELVKALADIVAKVDALSAAKTAEATAEAQSKVDEEAIGKEVDKALAEYDEKLVAINAAELLPSQVESLKIEARKGADVAPLIESAKKVADEAKTLLTESIGSGLRLSEVDKNDNFTVGRWNA